MARIHLDGIAHAYRPDPRDEADYAVRRMDHVWEDGGAYALLGPSGCGKTTLLNIISGLIRPSEGRILFGGEDVTDLEPQRRNIAQVFQFPVVYDTMTVFDNLAFPLRNRGVDEARVRERVGEVAAMLELTADLGKRARGLGAADKQKISLGRGLVRSDVTAILFDEPLTVIDPQVKFQLRRKLREIHERFRITLVYVTHDQNEALTFADQVVVMYEGQVVQLGTPQELFEEPRHTFVGYFIGSPGMNLLPARIEGGHALIEDGGGARVRVEEGAARAADGRAVRLGVRPEFLEVAAGPAEGAVAAAVEAVEDLGGYRIVTARLGRHALRAKLPEERSVPEGAAWLVFPPGRTKVYLDERLVG